jgi:uncharacterized protein YcbK (DUF882 family)
MRHGRRDLLKLVGGVAASALWGVPARAFSVVRGSEVRRVHFDNLHTGETLDAVYWEKGRYIPDALGAINVVLRDFRTGDVHPIAPALLDLLTTLQSKIGTAGPFRVISGYRSPMTNAMLASESAGVAHSSLHMQGMAIDIRLPDVALSDLHKAALDLGLGGVGYYPKSDFVHVDVGRVRHWG